MNFNRVAPYFERLERIVFHKQMQRCRTIFLSDLPSLNKAALVGEGDGRFLIELLKYCECEKIHYIDSSQTMLEIARQRLQKCSSDFVNRVEFYHRDLSVESMPDQNYDLIVTNFFLDVFDEKSLEENISKIAKSCKKSCAWLYADFQISGSLLRRLRSGAWIKVMYLFFKLISQIEANKLIDPSKFLDRQGFELQASIEMSQGLMRAERRQRA